MNVVKTFVKRALSQFGYTLSRSGALSGSDEIQRPEYVDGFLEGLYSSWELPVSILQCGANDGVTVDPVRNFILRHPKKVKAVLIEPLPDVYDALLANYAEQPHVIALNVAAGPNQKIDLYRIKRDYTQQYKGIIASGITSFDRNYVLNKAAKLLDIRGIPPEDCIEKISQECLSVSEIIDSQLPQLGKEPFLQIDAEGFDDQIIFTIDFMRHRPIAINYEVSHLSKEKHAALRDYLTKHGYYFIRWKETDELAVRMT